MARVRKLILSMRESDSAATARHVLQSLRCYSLERLGRFKM